MIEIFSIRIETALDLSLVAAFTSAVAFYFGKIINEISPKKEDPYINYVDGFVFLTLFIVFPVLVFYAAQNYVQTISTIIVLCVQIIIILVLSARYNAFQIERLNLRDVFNKEVAEKSAALSEKIKPIPSNTSHSFVGRFLDVAIFARFPNWLLIIFAVITINAAIKIAFSPESPILVFTSLFIAFASTSITAALFGWNRVKRYPKITVYLVNGTKKTGQLTKIDGGYVSMFVKRKITHISESQILMMETDKKVKTGGN